MNSVANYEYVVYMRMPQTQYELRPQKKRSCGGVFWQYFWQSTVLAQGQAQLPKPQPGAIASQRNGAMQEFAVLVLVLYQFVTASCVIRK